MKKHWKKLLAILLAGSMIITPSTVFGAENTSEPQTEEAVQTAKPVVSQTAVGEEAGQKEFKDSEAGGTIEVYYDEVMVATGSALEAGIEQGDHLALWDGDDLLDKDQDYTVAYADNKAYGTATMTLTGTGVYKPESISKTFQIVKDAEESNIVVTPHAKWFEVSTKDMNVPVYATFVAVSDLEKVKASQYLIAETYKIVPGETKSIYWSYSVDKDDMPISPEIVKDTQYALLFSLDVVFSFDEAHLMQNETTKTPSEGGESPYKKGIDANLKAVLQKNGSVKVSWSPKDKEEKNFALFQRNASDTKWVQVAPAAGSGNEVTKYDDLKNVSAKDNKKAFTESLDSFKQNLKKPEKLEVYLLAAYDSSGTFKNAYITSCAPYLFYAETSYEADKMNLSFSELPESDSMEYSLQLAMKNKNHDASKTTDDNGFRDEWSKYYPSVYMYSGGEYALSKTVSLPALSGDYDTKTPQITVGTNYYNRVKSVYYFEGEAYPSESSNVISRKSGPGKVYTLSLVGLQHDSKNQSVNKTNAQLYVDSFTSVTTGPAISGSSIAVGASVYGDGNEVTSAEAIDDAKAQALREVAESASYTGAEGDEGSAADNKVPYAHHYNHSTESKNGCVFFYVKKDSPEIKAYELLRCATRLGSYSKAKSYSVSSTLDKGKDLWKLEVPKPKEWKEGDVEYREYNDLYFEGYDLYCLWYNNFPPEQEWYYAVRAVSKQGGAAGGFAGGVENIGELDKVENADATIDQPKLTISWDHDDCVKSYYVYRSKKEIDIFGTTFSKDSEYDFNKDNYDFIGKTSGSSKKKRTDGTYYNSYVDTKVPKDDVFWVYVVRPVYDTKKAGSKGENFDYNADLCSTYIYGMRPIDKTIKNFKAVSEGIGKIRLSWSPVSGVDRYWLQRADGTGYTDPKVIPDSSWVNLSNNITTTAYADQSVDVGVGYYYRIKAGVNHSGGEPTWGDAWSNSAKVRSVPLPVTNVTASANGDRGAILNWSINPNDQAFANANWGGRYRIVVSWKDSNGTQSGTYYAEKNRFVDTTVLAGGITRTYTISVVCDGKAYSPVTKSYSKVDSIGVYYEDGKTPYTSSSLDMTAGQWAPLLAIPMSNGTMVGGMPVTVVSSNTQVVTVSTSQSGAFTKLSLHAVGKGSAVLNFGVAGVTRQIIINVK